MQDEIAAARRKKRRRYHLRRLVRFLTALVVVLISIVLVNTVTLTTWKDLKDGVRTFFTLAGGYPAELGASTPLQVAQMSRAYAVVTDTEFIIKSKSGADLLREQHGYVSPGLVAAENRAVLYNRGSMDVRVYNRSELIAELKADNAIIDADIASNGTLVILSESDRFRSQLSVYLNGKYEKAMSWRGASGFPICCAVSENGASAAVASAVTLNGIMYTQITSINLSKQTERYQVGEIEGLVAGLFCDNDGSVTVITDSQAVLLDSSGTVKNSYAYGVTPLLFVARDEGNRIALGFGDNSRADINSIAILDRSLKEVSVIAQCGIIKDIYLASNKVFVLGSQTVGEYSLSGKLQKVYDADPRAIGLVEFNRAIEILPDRAQRLEVHKTEEENDVADS